MKKKIFYINYLLFRPELPNIKGKYETLSRRYFGDMIAVCPKEQEDIRLGEFRFHHIPFVTVPFVKHALFIAYVLIVGLRSHRRQRIDYVVTFDPLVCGFSGYLLSILTGAKLAVEINGDIAEASDLGGAGRIKKLKIRIAVGVITFVIEKADAIKFINEQMKERFLAKLRRHTVHGTFFEYAPTDVFTDGEREYGDYVLFVGFPFYLKGVDILIKAFNMISDKHPRFKLKIIGHFTELEPFASLAEGNDKISFHKALYYDEIVREFKNCYCFALASRTEGLPRVLIEAMASGKAVVASNVGGIPTIVQDGETGFLFESENVDDLAGKLDILLSDPDLARRLGLSGERFVERNFSPDRYLENFGAMLDSIGEIA